MLILIFSSILNLSRAHFRPWLQKFVFSHRIYSPNFIQINNVQQCHPQFFELFLVILTPNFCKKSKTSCTVFFLGRPSTYYVREKSKIVRVTARSIWVGITHMHTRSKYSAKPQRFAAFSNKCYFYLARRMGNANKWSIPSRARLPTLALETPMLEHCCLLPTASQLHDFSSKE